MSEWSVLARQQPLRGPSGHHSLKDGNLASALTLPEFFEGLGGLMNLPPRIAEPRLKHSKLGRRAARVLIPAVAVVFGVFLSLRQAETQAPNELPAGLAGRWVTDAANYANRELEFAPDRIVFHTGDSSAADTEHLITRIKSRRVGDTTVVTLTYLATGSSYDLAFKYTAVPEARVRFTNQDKLVWRPEDGATP